MGRESDDGEDRERDRSVLTPDDLDITRDERAAPLSDGRFVIASDADSSPTPDRGTTSPAAGDERGSTADTPAEAASSTDDGPRPDTGNVEETALDRVRDAGQPHGFVIAARFGETTGETSVFGDDMGSVFRSLLLWYAAGVDSSTPPEEVLGVLLRAAQLPVRYPTGTLARLLERHGLSPEDPIEDLLEAVSDDGVRIA